MDIYIYGNKGFKEEIHKTLEHANIKFKIAVDAKIEDINSLDELKERIVQSPSDIYLIDEEKIIKKNLINQKIKLFTPKDAIEHEFLLENGVADVSVESLEEIPKYIISKYDALEPEEGIQDSIIEIVDDAYSNEKNTIDLDEELSELLVVEKSDDTFKEDVGLNNIHTDYDDKETLEENLIEELEEETPVQNQSFDDDIDAELSALMELDGVEESNSKGDDLEEFDFKSMDEELQELDGLDLKSIDEEMKELDEELHLDEIEDVSTDLDDELSSLMEMDDLEDDKIQSRQDLDESKNIVDALNIDNDENDVLSQALEIENMEDLDNILEEIELEMPEIKELNIEESKGEDMSQDDFSQLDSLSEADMLSALEGLDSVAPVSNSTSKKEEVKSSQAVSNNVEISSSNANDLAALLGQLLNNKTLEITIKIKD